MKGIGTEKVYKVFKKGARSRSLLQDVKSGILPSSKFKPAVNTKIHNSQSTLDSVLKNKQEALMEKEKSE
jgi:hypothetical protein